ALENITLPLDIARRPVDRAHLDAVVQAVGLADRLDHKPTELSGGQQQRVACARALVSRPAVVFADEPTGNLDSTSSGEVLGFLRRSVDGLGQSVVMVTHDPTAASYAHRVLFLADGRLVGELTDPTPESVLATLTSLRPAPAAAGVADGVR
ncbi:ABC transporter ATP-binding protein, partial [Cellulomonas olei]